MLVVQVGDGCDLGVPSGTQLTMVRLAAQLTVYSAATTAVVQPATHLFVAQYFFEEAYELHPRCLEMETMLAPSREKRGPD